MGARDGIKLEDQVLITETGYENLTRCAFDELLMWLNIQTPMTLPVRARRAAGRSAPPMDASQSQAEPSLRANLLLTLTAMCWACSTIFWRLAVGEVSGLTRTLHQDALDYRGLRY